MTHGKDVRSMKKATIADVAELAGVSKATVSRYLKQENVREEIAEKIRAAIEETGYVARGSKRDKANDKTAETKSEKGKHTGRVKQKNYRLGVLVKDIALPRTRNIIHALKDVSMEVKEGEIVSLIGANGAGKTTLLQTISGLLKKTSGEVVFLGKSMNKVSAKNIVKEGITQVPEGRHIFSGMSVYENLLMGAYLRKDKDGIKADLQDIYQRFPILEKRSSQDASTLSGGEQQMLAMGRALMARPKILLLDEPSMGLAPILVKEIFNIIKDINEKGTTVLLVEQNAKMALSIADRAYVMETGNIVMTGTGAELVNSPEIQKAYLGG